MDVFISYSKEKHIADAICHALENQGVKCWYAPRDILPGKEWAGAIIDALESCSLMVLVFSANSNQSVQVIREVERAVHNNKIIIPFRIEDIVPSKSMQYLIGVHHWLDAFPISKQNSALERLVQSVKENIDILKKQAIADVVSRSDNSSNSHEQSSKTENEQRRLKEYYHGLAERFLIAIDQRARELVRIIPENVRMANAMKEKPVIDNILREFEIALQENNKSKGQIPKIKVEVLCASDTAMLTFAHADNSLTRYKVIYLSNSNSNIFTKLSHAMFLLGYGYRDTGTNSLDQPEYKKLALNYNIFQVLEKCVSKQADETWKNISEAFLSYPEGFLVPLYDLIENRLFRSRSEIIAFEQARL